MRTGFVVVVVVSCLVSAGRRLATDTYPTRVLVVCRKQENKKHRRMVGSCAHGGQTLADQLSNACSGDFTTALKGCLRCLVWIYFGVLIMLMTITRAKLSPDKNKHTPLSPITWSPFCPASCRRLSWATDQEREKQTQRNAQSTRPGVLPLIFSSMYSPLYKSWCSEVITGLSSPPPSTPASQTWLERV